MTEPPEDICATAARLGVTADEARLHRLGRRRARQDREATRAVGAGSKAAPA
jgi:hypothetical protein